MNWNNDIITQQDYINIEADLAQIIKSEQVYPPFPTIYRALELTPLEEVKVVILGQDPYYNAHQANGLAFSVPQGCALPGSLKNIYKELTEDIQGFSAPQHGDLSSWARQGVLLLNTALTVVEKSPGSHLKLWEPLIDKVIAGAMKRGAIFLLWGNKAQERFKKVSLQLNDNELQYINCLKAAHPSPLSAYNGFFGCKHFSKVNLILEEKGKLPINWRSIEDHDNCKRSNDDIRISL